MNEDAAITEYRRPSVRVLYGSLPNGRMLTKPLRVMVDYDEEEVVVSEPYFHMHASAPTEAEAVEAFRRIFSGYLDILTAQEKLGANLREQLKYLRSYVNYHGAKDSVASLEA
ncbi:MAG: hypothetical protein ABI465_05305 [Ktedonobacteraceae bacterium]